MSERIIRRSLHDPRTGSRTDWEFVDRKTDEEIEADVAADPDAPPLADTAWFEGATLVIPASMESVWLHLDRDVLAWFRNQEFGLTSRVNAALREYMIAHGADVAAPSPDPAPRRVKKSGAA